MKQRTIIIIFIAIVTLTACGPIATFNEPQPPGTACLSTFPKRIQGQYLSQENNSILKITDILICRIFDFDQKVNINQLDSSTILSGDTLIDINTKEKTIIKIVGDTLVNHIHSIDTLFQLESKNILKKFKGYYFINTFYGKNSWGVKKIKLTKGQLTISSISAKQDIEQLKEITENSQDTVSYKFSPTKKQFKKFIKNGGFNDTEVFLRQK
jgi:hypothetical protein